jgi:hypothetical protein
MKEILKQLETIMRRGFDSHTVFNDWLDLILYALQRDDPPYLEIVRKYKNNKANGDHEIDYFANAFAQLQVEMSKTNDDILGQVYMQWNMNNRYRGQFFTPKHVASMMAKMTEPKGKILDPCCGSGVMLVESIKTMNNEAIDVSIFYGQDIDLTCVKMCALNLLFFNVNGFVIWGNSLTSECSKVYQTARSPLGGSIRELTGEEFELFKEWYTPKVKKTLDVADKSLTQEQLQQLTNTGEQLSFF